MEGDYRLTFFFFSFQELGVPDLPWREGGCFFFFSFSQKKNADVIAVVHSALIGVIEQLFCSVIACVIIICRELPQKLMHTNAMILL